MDPRTRTFLFGIGSGVAATLAFPIVAPIVAELARPVAKALLRGGLLGFDALRTQLAKLSESVEDLVAEVSAEVREELDRRAQTATHAASEPGGAAREALTKVAAAKDVS